MASPIGVDSLTSLTQRYIVPTVTDQFFRSNVLFYRLDRSNRRVVRGGSQIEVPLMISGQVASGWFTGFDLLLTTPTDNVRNAALDWKEAYANITIDGLTLAKNDGPEAIASILKVQSSSARMQLEDQVGSALFNDSVSNTKALDGLQGAIDNGTVAGTYAGLGARTTTNSFWQPATGGLDTTTTTLTLASMQTVFGAATDGSRSPTLLMGTQGNYNRYWNLLQVQQRFPTQAMGQDEQLAKAGFRNLLFNNVPFCVDSHVNTSRAGTTGDSLYYLNEEYIELIFNPKGDFNLGDFIRPVNQDAMVAMLKVILNIVVSNIQRQAVQTAITA